ncbi:LuxR C-terminal-related transcriptional regulator [Gordonia sp. NPDC003424]
MPETTEAQARALRAFLGNLRAADLDDFAATAAQSACTDLGFSKAMLSWVSGPTWSPNSVYVSPQLDPEFDDLINAVDGSAVPLLRAPREADLVRYRRPFILNKREYRDSYRPLIDLSDPVAYAAAPIVASGRTVAILHVDRHADSLGDDDLTLLTRGAHLCGLSYATLACRRQLLRQRTVVRSALSAMSSMPLGEGAEHAEQQQITTTTSDDSLTDREESVLRLLATGASNRSIAEQLYISDGTVKSHVRHIFRKIGVETRAQATAHFRARSAPIPVVM